MFCNKNPQKMTLHESSDTSLVEEKHELMVDFTAVTPNETQTPVLKTVHFIKPTLSPFSLLPDPPKIESLSRCAKPKVHFNGCQPPVQNWLTWVKKMQSAHEQTWRKAGIFDAVKGSTYQLEKHPDLLYSLAEKWFPESNTFVFSWGEVGITLEDVMVLGGFSPLGESVLSSFSLGEDVQEIVDKLFDCKSEFGPNYKRYITQAQWAEYFMGRGDELEHAAFLALWLSRHVFMTKSRMTIRPLVFPLAAKLSCGIKIALAPAVLAIIYKGLRLLKEKLVHCSNCQYDGAPLGLVALFHLVQLWVWERFPSLAPIPKMINHGEPRLARWAGLKRYCVCVGPMGLGMELDSAKATFKWRPYVTSVKNWPFPSFYEDLGKWVSINSDESWELFACCLRICRLEGLDDVEIYHPHRVAKQFGFDQDIPCVILRSDETLEITYPYLTTLLTVTKLYVPPRLFQGDVTVRYSDWWKGKSILLEDDSLRVRSRHKPTQVECDINTNGDLDENMEQSPEEVLRQPSQVECNINISGDLDENTEQSSEELLRQPTQLECNINTNEDLDEKMKESPEEVSRQPTQVECNINTNKDLDEHTEQSSEEILRQPTQVGCNRNMNEDLDEKMEQSPEEILRHCEQRKDASCGSISVDPPPGQIDQVVLRENPEELNTGITKDSVSISDDEEEGLNAAFFKRLVLDMDKRISDLEREFSELSAATKDHQ